MFDTPMTGVDVKPPSSGIGRHYVPAGLRVYAIGDVHGCLDLLTGKLAAIEVDLSARPCAEHLVVLLGDYVDRGPDSSSVLQALIDREAKGDCVCLRGNHEDVLLQFLQGRISLSAWIGMGGMATLLSYGIQPRADRSDDHSADVRGKFRAVIPQAHLDFLTQLRPWLEIGSCVFVHAGLRPRVALADQKMTDLLWIREDFLSWPNAFDQLVVHGHTPVHEPEVRHNRINIDTGAYATRRLTCLALEGSAGRFI